MVFGGWNPLTTLLGTAQNNLNQNQLQNQNINGLNQLGQAGNPYVNSIAQQNSGWHTASVYGVSTTTTSTSSVSPGYFAAQNQGLIYNVMLPHNPEVGTSITITWNGQTWAEKRHTPIQDIMAAGSFNLSELEAAQDLIDSLEKSHAQTPV